MLFPNMRILWPRVISNSLVLIAALLWTINASASSIIRVTDLAGREVRLPEAPTRIILGESRYLFALSILDTENPVRRIAGMLADLKAIDPGTYQQYQKEFPEIDKIPMVGHTSAESFHLERVLVLKPDLVLFGLEGHGPSEEHQHLIRQLEAADIPVVFLDFRQDPLRNTVISMTLLGKLLQKEDRAQDFINYYQSQLQRVKLAWPVQSKAEHHLPKVFIHSRVGLQGICCETMARGMMASLVEAAEGVNVAETKIPGSAGVLSLEYLLTEQPDVYIATAIGSKIDAPYIALGAGIDQSQAQYSFEQALKRSKVQHLNAIKSGQVHAIWHHFYNSPFNVVAVQVFAQWLYPERFSQLDPRQTLATLYQNFQPIPLQGTYWVTHEKTAL